MAQLVPFPADVSDEERELVAAGLMRLPKKPWDIEAFDHLPMPKVKGNAATQALLDDRDESM